MKIEPMKDLSDALLAIELRTKEPTETPHSQQTKTPPQTTEDKENAYPCQSIPRFKLGNRRALEVRAPPKPVTPNPQETIANINPCPIDPPSLTCHPAKSTPIQAADPNVHSNIETSLGSAPLASTKKKHHARMARLLQRPMLGTSKPTSAVLIIVLSLYRSTF